MNQIPNIEEVEQKLVKHLVDRFCGWHLPKDFHPDGGIMFMDVYDNGTEQGGKFEPVGTNLFTAEQAKEMFRFLLEHEDGTPILTELFHHQLQKAREEVKAQVLAFTDMRTDERYDPVMGEAFLMRNKGYNDGMRAVATFIHSELDQAELEGGLETKR